MLKMLSTAPYTFPAMQDASTLLHSHSYVSYGHQEESKEKQQSQVDDEDSEMTYYSGDSSGDSFGDSDTTPETSLPADDHVEKGKNQDQDQIEQFQDEEYDLVSNQPVRDEAMEEDGFDDEVANGNGDEDEAEQDPTLDLQPKLSEWQNQGGLMDINAAFEGSMLFDSTLEEIAAWCAPLVWKLFLRQEPACSKMNQHRYHLSLDTPCPPTLPKLLIKAMPRYKGGMTRAIAITHALLYLHRINICFHCNGASRDAIVNATVNATTNANTTSNANANGKKGMASKLQDTLRNRIERSFQSTSGEDGRIADNSFQCSLFFAVGMHFASLWLLDCCPADIKYWKNYVHCVPATHGIPWFRLVLKQWKYNITVSIDEWLFFTAQVLAKVPFKDELVRQQQLQQQQTEQQKTQMDQSNKAPLQRFLRDPQTQPQPQRISA